MARVRGGRTGRNTGFIGWLRSQFNRQQKPVWMLCAAHVLALGVALLLYALPHHVIPHGEAAIGVVSTRGGSAVPSPDDRAFTGEEEQAAPDTEEAPQLTPQPTAEPTPEPTQDPASVGDFRDKFPGMFTSGDINITETSYQSPNLNVQINKLFNEAAGAWTYVADIYIADISCLQTAFGKDTYGRGFTEWVTKIAERYESVVTMNGDYYGTRDTGVVIRNGTLYRDNKTTNDIAILYWDGHMEMFSADSFDAMTQINRGAYQSWCFGPSLLDESGNQVQIFNCGYSLIRKNPRSAIGYYEPGHYCFVTVDGRNDDSKGIRMSQLADFMKSLGCTMAYNLDGGQTSLLAFGTQLVNDPSDGGRSSSDYIMVVDRVTD